MDKSQLISVITNNLKNIPLISPYTLAIGITSFGEVNFSNQTDINIQVPDASVESFVTAIKDFNTFKKLIDISEVSKDLLVFLQTRIATAFVLGWVFRKVTNHRITLALSNNQIWRTFDLPYIDPKLSQDLPVFINEPSKEYALVLNVSRNIKESVKKHFEKAINKPHAILNYTVEGYKVESSAQALSLAVEIAKVIKNLNDSWGAKHLHIFAAMPAGLATLVAYHLNAICPISLYYMDEERSNYVLAGEIRNNS